LLKSSRMKIVVFIRVIICTHMRLDAVYQAKSSVLLAKKWRLEHVFNINLENTIWRNPRAVDLWVLWVSAINQAGYYYQISIEV
jgi:hypothetical protein